MHHIDRRSFISGSVAALGATAFGATAWADGPHGFIYPTPPGPNDTLRADVDNSRRIVDPPPPGYWPYSGISGPGAPVTAATRHGGWTSGLPHVSYKGPTPRSYPIGPWNDADSGEAVKSGLLPAIRPIWDAHIRDTIICAGGDGAYYMTGSTGDNIWAINDGVELWRSTDLKDWHYLGLVWSIEKDGTWEKHWTMRKGVYFRAIWAPEIHYIGGNYYICTSISGVGIGILKSTTGKATGPYVHAIDDTAPIKGSIDSTVFEDDDGRVYLTYGSAETIREIKPDFSAFAGDWQPTQLAEPDTNPDHHARKDAEGLGKIGFEGATLFKRNGQYYLGAVDKYYGRYSFAFAVADHITGPYRMRHEAVPCCGGGNIFRDHQGRWWQTFFGNDKFSPFREKPGLVRIDFDAAGRIHPHTDQPFVTT